MQRHRHDKIRRQQMLRGRVAAQSIRKDISDDPRHISMLVVFEVKNQPSSIQTIGNASERRIQVILPSCFCRLRCKVDLQPAPLDTADTMIA